MSLPDEQKQDLREYVEGLDHPIFQDESPFAVWLRQQVKRQDRVGGLARVACKDPYWRTAKSRQAVISYFREMGAREFVTKSVNIAWDEFERQEKRTRTKSANRMRNKQRKATRRSQRS